MPQQPLKDRSLTGSQPTNPEVVDLINRINEIRAECPHEWHETKQNFNIFTKVCIKCGHLDVIEY